MSSKRPRAIAATVVSNLKNQNMKQILPLLLILLSSHLYSQEQKDTTTYAFPIGSKFTLELIQVDSNNYKYHVLNMEQIDYSIDYSETDSLFSVKPIPGTIECFFAKGVDQDGPFKSVLILRNNSKIYINYKADIAYDQSGQFYNTSVHPLFPGVRSSELWNDNLTAIVIHKIHKEE